MAAEARLVRDAEGLLYCQYDRCYFVVGAASGFDELVQLQRHLRRAHGERLTLDEVREQRTAWERRDAEASGG